jgi:hypothetical protein
MQALVDKLTAEKSTLSG